MKRKLLFTCDSYVNEFDIVFNAIVTQSSYFVCIPGKLRSMCSMILILMGVFFILVVDLMKTSPRIFSVRSGCTLLIVIVVIKMMFRNEDAILLVERTMFWFLFKTLDMHIKIKLFKSYRSSNYGSKLWSLKDDVLQDEVLFVKNSSQAFIKLTIYYSLFLVAYILTEYSSCFWREL